MAPSLGAAAASSSSASPPPPPSAATRVAPFTATLTYSARRGGAVVLKDVQTAPPDARRDAGAAVDLGAALRGHSVPACLPAHLARPAVLDALVHVTDAVQVPLLRWSVEAAEAAEAAGAAEDAEAGPHPSDEARREASTPPPKVAVEVRAMTVVRARGLRADLPLFAAGRLAAASPELGDAARPYWLATLCVDAHTTVTLQMAGRANLAWRAFVRPGTTYAFSGAFEKEELCGATVYRALDAVEANELPNEADEAEALSPAEAAQARAATNLFAYQGVVTRRLNEWAVEMDGDLLVWFLHAPLPPRLWLGVRTGALVRFSSLSPIWNASGVVGFSLTTRSDVSVVAPAARPWPWMLRFELEAGRKTPARSDGSAAHSWLLSHYADVAVAVLQARDRGRAAGVLEAREPWDCDELLALVTAPAPTASAVPRPHAWAHPDADAYEFLHDWARASAPLAFSRSLRPASSLADLAAAALRSLEPRTTLLREACVHEVEWGGASRERASFALVRFDAQRRCVADDTAVFPAVMPDQPSLPFPTNGVARLALLRFRVVVERFGQTDVARLGSAVLRSKAQSREAAVDAGEPGRDEDGVVSKGVDALGVVRVFIHVLSARLLGGESPTSAAAAEPDLLDGDAEHPQAPGDAREDVVASIASLFPAAPSASASASASASSSVITTKLTELVFVVEAASVSYDSFGGGGDASYSASAAAPNRASASSAKPRVLTSGRLVLKARDLRSPLCVDVYVDMSNTGLPACGVCKAGAVVRARHVDVKVNQRTQRVYLKAASNALALVRGGEAELGFVAWTFPRDLARLPVVRLATLRAAQSRPATGCCVRACVVAVARVWLTWTCASCDGRCGVAVHDRRVLHVRASVDLDDGTDACLAYAEAGAALALVGLSQAQAEDVARPVPAVAFDKYASFVSGRTSPAGRLADLVVANAARRARPRLVYALFDSPPPAVVLPPSRLARAAVDAELPFLGETGAGDASSDEEEDGEPHAKRSRRATMSVRLRGGATVRTRLPESKVYVRVVSVGG